MGSSHQPKTWLEVLQGQLNIDIDCMDPLEAQRWLPFRPHDQTSNQRLVYEQMIALENQSLLLDTVKECRDLGWEAILTRMSALFCAKNITKIEGRVLLQTSASAAYDTEKIVAHARSYASELERVGISKDRMCIKIPCTGPALNASPILLREGIRTLGTSLFSVAQAIAASQAGCLSISPYYNLPWYHTEAKAWPNVDDPALQHPMSPRIVRIVQTYQRLEKESGKVQPMLKLASFKSAREAMASAELGCHHATLPEAVLQELSQFNIDSSPPPGLGHFHSPGMVSDRVIHLAAVDPLTGQQWKSEIASTQIDYLENSGAALDKAIHEDPVAARGLHEALEAFEANELQSRAVIEDVLRQLENETS